MMPGTNKKMNPKIRFIIQKSRIQRAAPAAAHLDARHAVVGALAVHVAVGGHVAREGVDGAAVVDNEEEQREALLGRRVEALGHAAVLPRRAPGVGRAEKVTRSS